MGKRAHRLALAATLALLFVGAGRDSAAADTYVFATPGLVGAVGDSKTSDIRVTEGYADRTEYVITGSDYFHEVYDRDLWMLTGGVAIFAASESAVSYLSKHAQEVSVAVRRLPIVNGLSRLGVTPLNAISDGIIAPLRLMGAALALAPAFHTMLNSFSAHRSLVFYDRSSEPIHATWPCRAEPRTMYSGTVRWQASCPLISDEAGIAPGMMIDAGGALDIIDLRKLTCGECLSERYVGGGTGDDLIVGTEDVDHVAGGSGQDRIEGRGGDDVIWGEDPLPPPTLERSDDHLFGGTGRDVVFGQLGNDLIFGGPGDDNYEMTSIEPARFGATVGGLDGGEGNDVVVGGAGVDIMRGGPDRDSLFADEADSYKSRAIDEVVDCGPGDGSRQYYRLSAGDPIESCGVEMNQPLSLPDLPELDPELPWPWFG